MVFHRSLSDSKSPLVTRTYLSILSDLNAGIWLVSSCPLISKPASPFTKPLRIVQSAPITTGNTVPFMFHRYFKVLFIIIIVIIMEYDLSSSSCAISTAIPDPLSPLLPIVHRIWQVLRATPRILTELLCVGLSW